MKVTVIGGGGWVGSATAFHIAARGLVDELVLVGRRQSVVQQHALDMATAFSAHGVTVMAGDHEDMAGSDMVINASGVPHTMDMAAMLAGNVLVVREIAAQIGAHCPEALLITATNPVDPLNYATWRVLGFARRQVIGYSLNDSYRFRQMVASVKGGKVGEVEATVIGEHGPLQVPLFSSVRIAGNSVPFTEAEKQAIRAARSERFKRIEILQKETSRTAGWTCAIGLAEIVAAICGNTGAVFPCSAVLEGEYGQRGFSMGVPVTLGSTGIQEIIEYELAPDEQAALAECAQKLQAGAKTVDQVLAGQSA